MAAIENYYYCHNIREYFPDVAYIVFPKQDMELAGYFTVTIKPLSVSADKLSNSVSANKLSNMEKLLNFYSQNYFVPSDKRMDDNGTALVQLLRSIK